MCAVHNGDTGAVRFAQLSGVVGIAQQFTVISQNERGGHVQKLFQLQIVVVPHPAFGQVVIVDVGKADHAMLETGQGMAPGILAYGGSKRIKQVFSS